MPLENCSIVPSASKWMPPGFVPGLISVILPTYNRAHLILQAMESVWAQTYRPVELIVIDDGSTDETAAVVREWGLQHEDSPSFMTLEICQNRMGAASARNAGLRASRGEFIQFLDSDDALHPQMLAVHKDLLDRHPEIQKVACPMILFHEWDELDGPMRMRWEEVKEDGVIRPSQLRDWRSYPGHTPTGLYRRFICMETGPWVNLAVLEDREYAMRLYARDVGQLQAKHPPVFVRKHGDSQQSGVLGDPDRCRDVLRAADKIAATMNASPRRLKLADWDVLARLYQNVARSARRGGRIAEGMIALRRAAKYQRFWRTAMRTPVLQTLLRFQACRKRSECIRQAASK